LTGFATEKLRQDLSHIEKKSTSTDSTDFIENEFSIVRRSLEKVIEKLKRDSSERFPKP